MSNPLFNGVASRDIIYNKGKLKWALFVKEKTNFERGFKVLADTERYPQIIERENSIGIQFHLDSLSPEPVRMLNNFCMMKLKEMEV